jgi:hypothetical protein
MGRVKLSAPLFVLASDVTSNAARRLDFWNQGHDYTTRNFAAPW